MTIEEKETENKIIEALEKKRFYNPHNVFHHAPEFYKSDDKRYPYEIHIVKWNTKSARVIMLLTRYDEKKGEWIFRKKYGVHSVRHGEKMR